MEKRENIIREVQNRVLAIVPDARIILYGSRARGDAREDSDWDFLILLEQVSPSLEKEILQSIYEYELLSQQPISVFITTQDYANQYRLDPFYQFIDREGIDLSSSGSRVEESDNDPFYSLVYELEKLEVESYFPRVKLFLDEIRGLIEVSVSSE